MCNDPHYQDYAEALTIDYFPTVLSYGDVLDAFFRSHDAIASRGRSRQYSSVIFTHGDEQVAAAKRALADHPHAATSIEPASDFWAAEPYHQKWLLQRKRPLMLALGLESTDELLGPAATLLNAVAAGRLDETRALARLDALLDAGELRPSAHGTLRSILDPF